MDLTHAGHPRRSAVALIGAVALLTACGGGDGGESSSTASTTSSATPTSQSASPSAPGSESAADKAVITISDFAFSVPDSVSAGTQISVTNDDSVAHTLTADSGDAFDVTVAPGATVTFAAPEKPGTYAFHCKPHPNMTSTLVVQ
ncbi:cupredoxin domain-containing protein [Corynebacterium sp.]|uniref:cupredoxin domain-containing protein n=1 Tax=Corynebacterium sp. TaxID=1720 RepID=UPI00264702A1|nr:cupredoxin domain-containing protein [Corynebacterium sp.]MDN5721117.1 cupredoxin domain-containing protein [Corynebacterium sp.]